jgi:ABC-type transport system involved in cytochrome c biogenesis permease subunit
MTRWARFAPAAVTLLFLVWLGSTATMPRELDGEFDLQGFGQLPVVYQGRVKPFDTLARNSLTVISDRQTWRDDAGNRRPAIEWLLDVMSNSPRAGESRVFRIHNLQLQTQLGLDARRGYRYAFNEFEPGLTELERQVAHAASLPNEQLDVYDTMVLELWNRVVLYGVLSETHATPGIGSDPHADLNVALRRLDSLQRFSLPHTIPPRVAGDEWKPLLRAVIDGVMTGQASPAVRPLVGMLDAWASDDPGSFNAFLTDYRAVQGRHPLPDSPALGFEAWFNHAAPFYHCALLYVVAFGLGCLSWLGWTETLRRTTFSLLAMTFVVHTLAIAARVYISGYPPITNLYGTAVFIGWGCVLLGLILEWVYRLGIGNLLASIVGFLTLIIAHFLAGDGDTLEMMQAVLDTKFWLATHVVIINFGYSATFLAGGLAVLYILRGVMTRSLSGEVERVFGRMIYGVLCFALLLSFVGTVLGGLWADDSWGRFWGWDPKENGALLIVISQIAILHGRMGGYLREHGVCMAAAFGGTIVAFSWWGVNLLGVGLHSYGFTSGINTALWTYYCVQWGIVGLGALTWWVDKEAAVAAKLAADAATADKDNTLPPDPEPSSGSKEQPSEVGAR